MPTRADAQSEPSATASAIRLPTLSAASPHPSSLPLARTAHAGQPGRPSRPAQLPRRAAGGADGASSCSLSGGVGLLARLKGTSRWLSESHCRRPLLGGGAGAFASAGMAAAADDWRPALPAPLLRRASP